MFLGTTELSHSQSDTYIIDTYIIPYKRLTLTAEHQNSIRKKDTMEEGVFSLLQLVIAFSGVQKIKVTYAISPTFPNVMKTGLLTFIISSRVCLIEGIKM